MTKQSPPVVWRYVGPGYFPGVPPRDLTQSDVDALAITDLLNIEASSAYELVNPITLDPLRELPDAEFEKLSPAEKGKRTREANERAEAAEEAAKTAQEAANGQEGAS